MTVDLFSLQQMQYISLPGEHKHLEISCEGSTPQEVPPQEVSTGSVSTRSAYYLHNLTSRTGTIPEGGWKCDFVQ